MTPTLKELPGRANRPDMETDKVKALLELRKRLTPEVMALVLSALEEAQREIAENYIGRSFENNPAWNVVTKAIEALDGNALNKT